MTTGTHAAEVEDEVWKKNTAFKNQEFHADLGLRALDRVRSFQDAAWERS